METKIFSILIFSFLILSLSFVGADISTTILEEQVIEVTESVEVSQGQVVEVTERCYSDKDCQNNQNIFCVVPIGSYAERKCNITTNKCYCDIKRKPIEVDYNEEFTLKKGEKAIFPKNSFSSGLGIILEDIYNICKISDYCYSNVKLRSFTSTSGYHPYSYMKEGDTKEFGLPNEKIILKLLKIENNKATFIVYPKEAECYQNNDCKLFYNTCTCNYECIPKDTPYLVGCPRYCEKKPSLIPKCECINNKCVTDFEVEPVVINQTITGHVISLIENNCEGCFSNNECLPIGYKTSDKYCDADKTMKIQKSAEHFCNNNFECKTNVCVNGKCISSGLIQKILDFFKKIFGL